VVHDRPRAPVEAELGEDQVRQGIPHALGDHVGLHQAPGLLGFVRAVQFDDGLDGLEPDQLAVLQDRILLGPRGRGLCRWGAAGVAGPGHPPGSTRMAPCDS